MVGTFLAHADCFDRLRLGSGPEGGISQEGGEPVEGSTQAVRPTGAHAARSTRKEHAGSDHRRQIHLLRLPGYPADYLGSHGGDFVRDVKVWRERGS